ncbi:AMP-binding protein, partial [Methanosphaera sp.]|uniref:AMP-binding protein n=1 Tax=Methanosphaera sp. TaxID=2666342 RepID=UPI0025CFE3AD
MNQTELNELKLKISKLDINDKKMRDLYLRKLALGEIQGPMLEYASVSNPWYKYYDEEAVTSEVPEKSMFQYLIDSVSEFLDAEALDLRMDFNNFDKSIRTLTYRQFLEETVTVACGLIELGIKPNEIFLNMIPNVVESRECIYGGNGIGATVYPISPMIPTSKFSEIIKLNSIKNVAIFGAFYDKFSEFLNNDSIKHIIYLNGLEALPPLARKIAMLTDKEKKYTIPKDSRIITWDKILNAGKKYRRKNKIKTFKDFKPYYEKNHIAVIVGTSGTTGIPKGACLTDRAVNACDFSEELAHPFEAGEVNLDVLIQSISYGLGIMHHTMCGGLKNIIIPQLVTDKIAMLLKKFRPQHFSGGPIHYENIIKSDEYKNGELPQPKNYLCGGASLSKKTEKELNGNVDENYVEPKTGESKVFVRQGLGSTENMGTGIFTTRGAYKFGSVGIPIALSNCGIFKYGTDEELPYGEVGEICMSGDTVMEEYLNNPEETAKVIKIHSDGTKWLHLGDEGYMDKDGHVYMLDRYKNIFMRNGFNVHPEKIRETLLKSPHVADCCVVGVDHPIEMSVPVA